ncbi:hypothetical protein C900_03856 [Fulvivirga imtechensis AK7]|uniref:N-formylglutamate amidohydrolase n=2 Tax=Fulvivirga TaxID=396811 RepID=L8JMM2_9BACT|nr:hypothetical protein C900_03856 [Fulvivirga imtechensis AK7]
MFAGADTILMSHRGWDPGALNLAKYLARQLEAPLFIQKASRLLIEMNRSLYNKELFSEFTTNIEQRLKDHLLEKYYYPYRTEVEQKIAEYINQGSPVLHLSVHTFTPVLNGIIRTVDIGLLYDDARLAEKRFCEEWKLRLNAELTESVIMLNCPYNGADDGFTTYLRTKFQENDYLGIELEINQKHNDTPEMKQIKEALVYSLSPFIYR